MLHAKRALNILKPKKEKYHPTPAAGKLNTKFQYIKRNKRKWNIDCDVIAVLQNIELALWVISFVNMQFDKLMIWIYILFILLNGAFCLAYLTNTNFPLYFVPKELTLSLFFSGCVLLLLFLFLFLLLRFILCTLSFSFFHGNWKLRGLEILRAHL